MPRAFGLLWFSSWLWGLPVFGLSVQPSFTIQGSAVNQTRVSPGGQVGGELGPGVWSAGARIGLPDRLDSKLALAWRPLSWLSVGPEVYHQWLWNVGTQTSVSLTLNLGTPRTIGLRPYGSFGLVRRYFRLSGFAPVPGPWGHDTAEWDLLADFGVQFPPLYGISPRLGITTRDPFEAYRLNNPAAQIAAAWQMDSVRWEAALRYRILLGFGRLDELAVQVSAQVL